MCSTYINSIMNQAKIQQRFAELNIKQESFELIKNLTFEAYERELATIPTRKDDFVYWGELNKYHRDFDLPAVIYDSGRKEYYKNGLLHRDNDKPAIEESNEYYAWFINGLETRADGKPSSIDLSDDEGMIFWKVDGEYFREGDLPCVVSFDGTAMFYLNGMRGRINDLPAIVNPNGLKVWYINNQIARADGKPSIITPQGKEYVYNNGVMMIDGVSTRIRRELKPNEECEEHICCDYEIVFQTINVYKLE